MEESVSTENIHLEQRVSSEELFDCLQKIKEGEEREKKERVKKNGKGNKIEEDQGKGEQEDESETEVKIPSLADKLLEALNKNDTLEVWELVKRNSPMKTLESLDKRYNKEKRCNRNCSRLVCCVCGHCECCGCCKVSCADKQQNQQQRESDKQQNNKHQNSSKDNDEEKRKWIKILSNPLFISVEWLWRTKDRKKDSKGNKMESINNNEDVIEVALDNACLLKKIASCEHHYSQDEYKRASKALEKFAVDVIEGNTSSERYADQIMDIRGNGCLLTGVPKNFMQSLSLLKIAANKGRKKFVASPRSQFVLNEIIYYKWEDWQDKSTVIKFLWFLLQLILVTVCTFFYIFYRIFKKMRSDVCPNMCSDMCLKMQSKCSEKLHWRIESLYEHPYSKFINHTMSYIVFVSLLFAATFGFVDEYRTSSTGLSRIDYAVLAFVAGLSMQEIWELYKQGIRLYFSKWWNIVDTLTLLTFLVAYLVWLVAWWMVYGEWQPRADAFIVADVFYASATVMAYFHLTHAFQVNSTLGPLQLSLYRMLKDVLKFLLIFFMLYIAFASGVVKVYSYYVASQIKIRDQDNSNYQDSHPYAEHENTFIGLVWLLVGYVEEDKIEVDDPAFNLTSTFARLGLVAYLVCTTIVALNMLIAMMNNSFYRVMEDADVEWKFSRAQMWLEWIDKGNAIPVPFNIIYYVLFVFFKFAIVFPCWIITGCRKGKWLCCHVSPQRSATKETDDEQGRENQACTSEETGTEQDRENQNSLQDDGTSKKNDPKQGRENQTPTCICHCRCCSRPVRSGAVRKERMDAMTYLVARYLNDRYLAEGKFNPLLSGMESQVDARTGQVNIENAVN